MKKARKSKFVIGGVALLSCVALAGVGYSSWVITSTVTSQTGNVSVTASAVEDDRITIDTVSSSSSLTYSFGPSGNGTYISASGESEESLSVTFTFDVSCADTGMTFSGLTKSYDITLALASNKTCDGTGELGQTGMDALEYATTYPSGSPYLDAPASGLVGTGITIATVTKSGVQAESGITNTTKGSLTVSVSNGATTSSSATITVTAAFGWGTYFGSANPVALSDDSKLDDYIDGLNWLYSAFSSATFTYTIGGAVQTTETSAQTESTNTGN